MYNNFKKSVIENRNIVDMEKKQRLKTLSLRDKFLVEWASSILGLNDTKKKIYISKLLDETLKKDNFKSIINKIEKDFFSNNINISSREIEFKAKDFHLKANVITENKFKLNNWK